MGGLNPHKRFARALADVIAHHPDAARIIITGDLAHWGETRAYEALQHAIADLPVAVRLLIGNHDNRATFRSVFPEHPVDANGFVNHAETLNGVRFLYLDSVGEKTHAGHFCDLRRAWMREELAACERARVFLHHNPMPLGLPAEDQIALIEEDRGPFLELIRQYAGKIDYLHFGHVHAPIHGRLAGVSFASAPSTGNQSIPDLNESKLLKGAPLPPAYSVLLIDQNDTTIHQIPFAWDGPVITAGTAWNDWAKPEENAE